MEAILYRFLNIANILFAIGLIVVDVMIFNANRKTRQPVFPTWVLVSHISIGIGWTLLYALYILEPWIGFVPARVLMAMPMFTFTLANILSGAILHYKATQRKILTQQTLKEQERFIDGERDN